MITRKDGWRDLRGCRWARCLGHSIVGRWSRSENTTNSQSARSLNGLGVQGNDEYFVLEIGLQAVNVYHQLPTVFTPARYDQLVTVEKLENRAIQFLDLRFHTEESLCSEYNNKKKNMILSKTSCYSKAVKAGVVKSLIRDALDRSCINFISKLLEGQWKRLGAKQFGVETPNCFRLRRVTPFETGAHECTKAHCEKLIPCENSVVYEISMTWVLRM